MPETDVYVVIAVLLTILTGVFAYSVYRTSAGETQYYLPLVLMTGIGAVFFMFLSQGIGLIEMEDGRMPAGRYLLYAILYFLMSVSVGQAGGLDRRRTYTLGTIMVLVISGLALAWGPAPLDSVGPLLTIGLLVLIAYLLLGPYNRRTSDLPGEQRVLFAKLRNLLLTAWCVYLITGFTVRGALGLLDVFSGIFMATYIDFVVILMMGVIILRSGEAMNQVAAHYASDSPENQESPIGADETPGD